MITFVWDKPNISTDIVHKNGRCRLENRTTGSGSRKGSRRGDRVETEAECELECERQADSSDGPVCAAPLSPEAPVCQGALAWHRLVREPHLLSQALLRPQTACHLLSCFSLNFRNQVNFEKPQEPWVRKFATSLILQITGARKLQDQVTRSRTG